MYSSRTMRDDSTTTTTTTLSKGLGLGIVRTEFVEIDRDEETFLRPISWIPVQTGNRGQGDAGMLQDQAAKNETLRSKQYAFGIRVWGRLIHTKVLLQSVVACVRESLCDYFVDAVGAGHTTAVRVWPRPYCLLPAGRSRRVLKRLLSPQPQPPAPSCASWAKQKPLPEIT